MIEAKAAREWIVRLQDGENLVDALRGLGMGYWNGSEYEIHTYPDPAELLSLQGNLATDDAGQRIAHAHLSLSRQDGSVRGGHLVAATVHNTLEMGLLPLEGIAMERRSESNGLVGLFPRVL